MNTEEKAKAYDEALKKMQPLYEQAKKDDNPIWSTYEYLFPQLRESENERIRKELIFFLKEEIVQCSIKEHADKLKEFVSYLEEKKEQEPVDVGEIIRKARSEGRQEVIDNLEYYQLLKPAEWSKEDEKMLNQIEYHLKDWDSIKERQGYQDNHASPSPIKWIKSLPERFNIRPQQKDNECISPEEGDIVVNKYGEISVFENWGHHPDGGSFNDDSYFFAKCTLVGDNYDDYDCHPDSEGLRYATPEEIRKIIPYLLNEKV